METKIVKLSDINIKTSFWLNPPRPSKINACYSYYLMHHNFDRDIIVDRKMTLQDGYVAYLVAKMMGCTTVYVKINNKIMVAA